MLLKKIELLNYGLYKGYHVIEFPRCTGSRTITLIGGLNGRGKTTLLEAVFLVLYGRRALRFLQDERISYSEYLRHHVNKSADDQQTSITLTLLKDENSEDTITIQRYWSIRKNIVTDNFTAYKNGIKDPYLSENWDYYVEEILPLSISRFFFFDNEKIAQIADDNSYESVKDSIKLLLGLTTVDQLINDMKKLIKRVSINNNSSVQSEAYQKMIEAQQGIEQCEKDIAESVALTGRLNREVGQARKQYADLENIFWSQGGNLRLKREKIEAEKNRLNELLLTKKEEVKELVNRAMTPLLICQPLLERTYNQVQQDDRLRSAKYSSTIIERLKELLTASALEQPAQKVILDFLIRAQSELRHSYAGGELPELAPVAQSIFSTIIGQATKQLEDVHKLIVSIKDLDNQIQQLELHLNYDVESTDVKDIWDKMRQLTQRIIQLETQIHVEEEKQQTLLKRQEMFESRRKAALKMVKLDEQGQDEAMRMIKYASMTIEVMEAFKVRLQQRRVKQLEQQIFDCFTFIAQKESLIQKIEINPETLDIRLIDYLGSELLKNQLSAGEKQIFAVSILWGLANCSGYQMPVIVDTPLGRLDSNHRTNILKNYFPYASKQVIVLSTDEEINGKYYELIEPYLNKVFLLDYNEQNQCTSIRTGYFGGIVQ
ncbi:MAG: DNA sulfur modification protein DndD [Bacillota bacterium]|jgi:DNA sulfur modification protein DndD